jgi:hypothetical protein
MEGAVQAELGGVEDGLPALVRANEAATNSRKWLISNIIADSSKSLLRF